MNPKHAFSTPSILTLFLVFGLGLAIRIIALANIEIINPDGILYIYQAKAISTGQWHLLNQCQLSYVSLYAFLISLFHIIVPKWVLSAQMVSLCFGFGMLVVLYPLLRQFFNSTISQLTLLLYAFIPIFVRYSVDAMRDPIFWFFYTASICLFVLYIRQNENAVSKKTLCLLLSSSCLIMLAAWSRIEGTILLPVACFFIVIAKQKQKFLRLFVLLLPQILFALIIVLIVSQKGFDILSLIRVDSIAEKALAPFDAYQGLLEQLSAISNIRENVLLKNFLENVQNDIWLIALGTILSNALESFFFPYVPFFCLGLTAVRKQIKRQPEFFYLLLIILFSFLLLYIHVLQSWIMAYRFICMLIIPACVLAGLGIEKSIALLTRMGGIGDKKAVVLIAIFIVAVAVYKNVKPIESDKAVYRQLADTISQSSQKDSPICIAARTSTVHMWVQFYANSEYPQPFCHLPFSVNPASMDKLKAFMRSKGVTLFLWEESMWKKSNFGKKGTAFVNDFDELGRWYHDDPGELILFRLKESQPL